MRKVKRQTVSDYDQWVASAGAAPELASPSSKHLYGWFYLTVLLETAAVLAINLGTHDAWYDDQRVRLAYNPKNGTTTPMQAYLRLEAAELINITDDLAMTAANKVKLLATATRPYLYGKPAGQEWVHNLVGAFSDPFAQFQLNFAAAAAAQHGLLRGRPSVVQGTATIDLYTEDFQLKNDGAGGWGADQTCILALRGALSPNDANAQASEFSTDAFNPNGGGTACQFGGSMSDQDAMLVRGYRQASIRDLSGFAAT